MVAMNFKKFKKKDECRSLSIEAPKLLEKNSGFFSEIKQMLTEDEYSDWESQALFFLFLKPDINLDNLRPEKIEEYSKSMISLP